jgi:hypothetical protein
MTVLTLMTMRTVKAPWRVRAIYSENGWAIGKGNEGIAALVALPVLSLGAVH